MSSRQTRNTKQTDQNVLTIFLPLLAVALLACAAGCCYREKRRKKKLKAGATSLQEEQQFNDAASIISTNSRRRSYLMPNSTTDPILRNPSRGGSVKSGYSVHSSYGEPPPYSGKASRRASLASTKAVDEDNRSQRNGVYNDGFSRSQRTLSRSRSMLDLNSGFNSTPMRRTHSSANLRRHSHHDSNHNNGQRSRYDQDLMSQRSERDFASNPGQRRNSRRLTSMDADYIYNQAPSVASMPTQGRRSSMMRSVSQPNLANTMSRATRTYPQGILKPGGSVVNEEDRYRLAPPSVSGGSTRGGPTNQMETRSRSSSRLQPGYGTGQSSYDTYSRNPTANFTTMSRNPSRSFNNPSFGVGPPSYSHPHQDNGRNWNQQQNQASFDPYNLDSYWEFGSTAQGMGSQNPYTAYGSTRGY